MFRDNFSWKYFDGIVEGKKTPILYLIYYIAESFKLVAKR